MRKIGDTVCKSSFSKNEKARQKQKNWKELEHEKGRTTETCEMVGNEEYKNASDHLDDSHEEKLESGSLLSADCENSTSGSPASSSKSSGRRVMFSDTKDAQRRSVSRKMDDTSSASFPDITQAGMPQQYYRWGCGGWQSACCTTTISIYSLPMSTKRQGARIAGRKMNQGAFKKVLEKLVTEGYNFSNPIGKAWNQQVRGDPVDRS